MANPYKDYQPQSITQLNRAIQSQTISIAIRGQDRLIFDPVTQTYVSALNRMDISAVYGEQTATRRMVQKGGAALSYEFLFPPSQVQYDKIGFEIVEIPRPLLAPIVEQKSQQNNRAAFQFLVAKQFDGMVASVDEELRLLQFIANAGLPVSFENFDSRLNSGYWLIAEFQIQSSRVNNSGAIVAAECSIGLIEYTEIESKFISLPRLTYTSTKKSPNNKSTKASGGEPVTTTDFQKNVVAPNYAYEEAEDRAEKRRLEAIQRKNDSQTIRKYGSNASTKNKNTSVKPKAQITPSSSSKPTAKSGYVAPTNWLKSILPKTNVTASKRVTKAS